MDLDIIRQEIDQIDDQIVKLLEERMHLVEGWLLIRKLQVNRFQILREKKLFLKRLGVVQRTSAIRRLLQRLFRIYSNVRVIIRIKISNEKEQFYPLGIFLAAMLGGLVRYLVSTWLPASPDFPWGTLFVNYLGIFCLIYLVKGYLVYKGTSKGLILALGTGFCGGLTTFSSLMLDTVKLLDTGRYLSLILYLLLSIGGGLLLAYYLGRKKW